MQIDPVCGMKVDETSAAAQNIYKGKQHTQLCLIIFQRVSKKTSLKFLVI